MARMSCVIDQRSHRGSIMSLGRSAFVTPRVRPAARARRPGAGGLVTPAPRIVVLGSLNVDLVTRVPALPRPGETVIGDRLLTFTGGKGANQAVAAARLGGRVAMVGRVGRDAGGDALLRQLA